MGSSRLRDWALLGGVTLLLFSLDQITKVLVVQNLAVGESWAPVIALEKIFTITHVRNTGVAFGQLSGLGWLFMLVNVIVVIGVLVYYPRIPRGQWPLQIAAALILAGALGNVVTRLQTAVEISQVTGSIWTALPKAYVVDFFDFKIWPVWNIADLCVVTGTAILALMLWREEKKSAASDAVANEP
ncbi:signal peptidase II [Chloroflexota bacterium]